MFEHAIFIPITHNSDKIIEHVKRSFAKWFGGFTAIRGDGGWVDVLGRLIEEPVVIIGTVVDPDEHVIRVLGLADEVKAELEQEAVLVIVHKHPEFV